MNNQIQKVVSSETQIFKHEMFGDLRVIKKDNKPYFVGKDVAKALGYADTNDAITTHFKHPVKHLVSLNTGSMRRDGTYVYRSQQINIIPESDMYRLIMRLK